ncbi:glycoside hydrolase family 2 protein [Cellvibrio sp. NN19]|uniref:glycoside hydrolase family 2 protein n=1 Tax=Cellvibrio chitinivorans TaxID=3102792 RepID=UPI002B410310|nr:glycoside hydrolase family 2 TIM barrel-domain containing protein [Cellvibrio sp. NN19]
MTYRQLIHLFITLLAYCAAPASSALSLRPELLLTNTSAREHISLNGDWVYSKDLYRTGLTDINGWVAKSRMQRYRDINIADEEKNNPQTFFEFDMQRGPTMKIPGAWNAAEQELRYYNGLIWFQKEITIEPPKNKRAFLYFEAVNYHAHVYLNGQKIGEHKGGFTPFTFEVSNLLRKGLNRITVGVDSSHDPESIPGDITDWDLYGGITRTVRLVFTAPTFIDDAYLQLDKNGSLVGEVVLNGPKRANQSVKIYLDGKPLPLTLRTNAQGVAQVNTPAPRDLHPWSPNNPKLYSVKFTAAGDSQIEKIGFRTLETQGARLLLNGEPVFLAGVSLHEEELGSNPGRVMTESSIRALFKEVKEGLHGNYIRLSHYPHSELASRIADEMGLLLWSEIPVYWSIDFKNPRVLLNAQKMMAENIYRDRNRAAIIIWSIANETPIADDRNHFLHELAQSVRTMDSTRLVSAALLVERKDAQNRIEITTNDPLIESLDILAINTYNGWYGEDQLSDLVNTLWHIPTHKPLILSEFGADAKAGVHAQGTPFKFSEEYQAEYYRQTLLMADKMNNLTGMSPWILKDFQSPRREHPVYQQGWNRKGLLSETGERKQAFKVLADYYLQRKANTLEPTEKPLSRN